MVHLRSLSRYKAAAAHFLISSIVAVSALAVMLAFWFPSPYFKAMGGIELIALIVGIDIALGPVLTLIAFDVRKKNLALDLCFIATLQIGALGYGIHAMHLGRPVFTVFTGKVLAVVSAAEIDPDELAKSHFDDFRHLSLTGPQLVAAIPSRDPQELANLILAEMAGYGIQKLPRYYVPFSHQRDAFHAAMQSIDQIERTDTNQAQFLRNHPKYRHKDVSALRYLPVITRHTKMVGVLDATSGELLDII